MRERIEATLDRFGVRFDTWFSERSLHERGQGRGGDRDAARARPRLRERGRASGCGPRSSATTRTACWSAPTASPPTSPPDIAYHRDKLERGAERLIDSARRRPPRLRPADAGGDRGAGRRPGALRGADHAARPPGARAASGAQMSKRKGEFVTLDELIDDIGVDAARFFMLQRSHETTLDLDLELARRQSQDNPVYYVQYAHARIASILRKARRRGQRAGGDGRRRCRRGRRWPVRPRRWGAGGAAEPTRAGAGQAAARASRRGARRRRAPRAAPPGRLRDGDRGRLPRLLPRLPGGRGARRARGGAAGRSAWRRSGSSPGPSTCSGSAPRADVAPRRGRARMGDAGSLLDSGAPAPDEED